MKLLTFVSSIDVNNGGPSRSVPMLVKGLSEIGVNVTLMTFRTENMNTHALDGTSAKLHILEPGYSADDMEGYVCKEHFDLIQIQSMWDLPYHKLMKIARKHHIPYIITPRGMLEPWSMSQKRWKKKLAMMLYQRKDLNHAACIYTTAEMEARHVHDLGIKVPCAVIPNGIEIEGYPCRTSMDIVKKQILFLSRVHVKKGIEILLEAFAKLRTENLELRDWTLKIVGNGEAEYIESLKLRVESLKLEDSVEIMDPVFGQAKVELYQSSALFVLPSYSENFGMVIAEAMSCGVPALTTTNCPWEILNETNTGWCIALSVENLTKTMREAMCMEPSALYDMGQRSSQLVFDHFNYRNVARKTKEIYEWILGEGDEPDFIID